MAGPGLTERGVAALRAGDAAAARALLAAAISENPGDSRAWLWLSGAVADPVAQRFCLERALALDPACAPARAGLAALGGGPEAGRPGGQAAAGPLTLSPAPALPLSPAPVLPRPGPPPPRSSPWRAIWLRPRAAMAAVAAGRPSWEPWLLAAPAGVGAALAWAAWGGLGSGLGAGELLGLAVVAGVPLGPVALLLGGVPLRTGGWLLGGHAGAGQVRAALAWSLAPVAAGLPLWLALLAAASFGVAPGPAQGLLAAACGVGHAALWAWAAALSVLGLAAAHSFTPARAAASWLLAALIVAAGVGAVLGLAALVIGLRGG